MALRRRKRKVTRRAAPRKRRKRRNPAPEKTTTARRRKRKAAPKRRARRRTVKVMVSNPAKKRRRKAVASAPKRKVRRSRRLRANPEEKKKRKGQARGLKSASRARKSIKYGKKHGGALTKHYIKKYKMNPGGMVDAVKAAFPIAASFYASRFVCNRLGPHVPGLGGLGEMAKPLTSALCLGAFHFATKKGPAVLKKHRAPIMIGAAFGFIDSLVSVFAPASVKGFFEPSAPAATSDYFQVGEYVQVGGYVPPIDDDITLSDYIQVGELESELGMLESELGMLEQDLGDNLLGGVSQGSMLKPVPSVSMVAPVPSRSFTKAVPMASQSFDNPAAIYTGIFAGGF